MYIYAYMSKGEQYFIKDRNKDLLSVFHKILLSSTGHITLSIIIDKLYHHPAQRFYISEEEAIKNVYSIIKNGKPKIRKKSDLRNQMYEEITRRALQIKEKDIQRPLNKIIDEVIYQSAPMFYLTKKTLRKLISNLKNRKL